MLRGSNTKYTAESLLKTIQEKLPHIADIRGFTDIRHKCEFLDSRNDKWFWRVPRPLLSGESFGHPAYKIAKQIVPVEETVSKIRAKYPHITYLRGYDGTKKKCTFLDERSNEEFETTPARILLGQCTGSRGQYKKKPKSFKEVLTEIQRVAPHIVQLDEYVNVHSKCRMLDSRNQQWFVNSPRQILCGKCVGHPSLTNQHSKNEQAIRDWILSLGIPCEKKRFKNLELDVFVPSLGIGIEYNGSYWHSDIWKDRNAHLRKTNRCADVGVRLMHVWDWEWIHRQDQTKSFILSALRMNEVVYARTCDFREIDHGRAHEFAEAYHIQGSPRGTTYAIGCFRDDELIGISTFGKHHRQNSDSRPVLTRLCFKTGVTVAGGFSKMCKMALAHLRSQIVSFIDLSKSPGIGYLRAGWKIESTLAPDYFYVDRNSSYVSKQSRRKKAVKTPSGMTEKSHARIDGLVRVWDCGKMKVAYG